MPYNKSKSRSSGSRPSGSQRPSRNNGTSNSFRNGGSRRSGGGGGSRQGRPARPMQQKRRGPKKDYIDPSRFIKVAKPVERQEYVAQHTFADFGLDQLIFTNLTNKGFVAPSPIQDQSIPHVLDGRDIIGIADTGTGKTAAFGVPLLHRLLVSDEKAIIMAPTRELAQQIDAELQTIAKGSGMRSAILIGGAGMGMQFRALRANPQIVIGTPGRIKDHLERGSLQLHNFSYVVLDEVDRMLDMGFINDMRSILQLLPAERQSLFFSATMDNKVSGLIETFSNDPVTVSVKTGDTGENIHQNVVRFNLDTEKIDKLHDLLIGGEMAKTIIFDDTQRSVERLAKELAARGFNADAIHGGKTQGQRQRSLRRFKESEVTILVATDVAARGIDVADVTHVVNYSVPQSYADYVHRIGRAGRAGRVGHALTFVSK